MGDGYAGPVGDSFERELPKYGNCWGICRIANAFCKTEVAIFCRSTCRITPMSLIWCTALARSLVGGRRSGVLQTDGVVHGLLELLFAPQVTFGRLDRSVAQQKLDLLQLATRQ